jgi:hypothetical protein
LKSKLQDFNFDDQPSRPSKAIKRPSRSDPLDGAISAAGNSIRVIAGALWAITAVLCLTTVYRFLYLPEETPIQNYYRLGFWFVVSGVLARCFEGIAKMIG